MKVLIIGPGGVGQTSLIGQLRSLGFETNDQLDRDLLKHCNPTHYESRDELIAFAPDKIVYVWNDPLLAILSMERRGWLRIQHCRLKEEGRSHFQTLEQLWHLTLSEDCDVFGIQHHRDCWSRENLFIFDWRAMRYRDFRGRFDHFLGLKSGSLDLAIEGVRRIYDLGAIPAKVRQIYAELDSETRSLNQWQFSKLEPFM